MSRVWIVLLLIAGCGGAQSAPAPAPPRATGAAIAIADAEAARAGGAAALIARAGDGDPAVRAAALRGLGRVGSAEAIAELRRRLAGDAPDATAAAAALGLAASLGDVEPDPALTAELVAAAARPGVDRAAVLTALGRAGEAEALRPLTAAVADSDASVAAAAATALGRFGRRKLALDDAARAALVAATAAADRELRFAATWALSREQRAADAAGDPVVETALRARVGDGDPEIRATAIAALTRRKAVVGTVGLVDRLQDADWRVAVEAVRALAGDAGTPEGRQAVAVYLVGTWVHLLASAADASPHPLLEGLRALAGHADAAPVRAALEHIVRSTGDAAAAREGTRALAGWASCLALAALARPLPAPPAGLAPGDAFAQLRACGAGLADHERKKILADAIANGAGGDPDERWAALRALMEDRDPRAVAAALTALPVAWPDLGAAARGAAVAAIVTALDHADAGVAGAAAEAAGAIAARADAGDARAALAAALVARAARPAADAELATTILGALADGKVAEGRDACARARGDARPAVAQAGRDCVKALGGDAAPAAPVAAATLARPPVDLAAVVGHRVTWQVETSRGRILIALEPDAAPWHVAAIVALTRLGFYDGLLFHRVVPGFVVQGGDPTGSGWGGPGFTLPSEPGDGRFERGAVGIADAGKDTGGSQWFVMHARAPHLDGRYTRIGRVVAGQAAVEALVVGDRIVRATVAID